MTTGSRFKTLVVNAGHPSRLLPAMTTGLVIGLLSVVQAASYSALIFSGDLSAFVGYGLGLTLLATLIGITFIALLASLPGAIGGSQDIPAVVMAVAAAAIAQQLSGFVPPQEVFVTVVFAIGITTLVTGACLFALGHLRLGQMVRFLPYPVIGGILAGTGWLLTTGAIAMITSQPLGMPLLHADMLARWVPGMLFGVLLLWAFERSSNTLLFPGMVLAGTALFHAVMFGAGMTVAEVSAQGWLLGPFSEDGLWRPWSWDDLAQVHWLSIVAQAATLATMPALCAVALLLNATGLEITMQRDANLNRELKAAGVANLFAGSVGGLTCYHKLGMSIVNFRVGGASRLTALVAALVCGFVLFQGAALMTLFPRMVLGGVTFFLGLSLLVDWIWKAWFRLPKTDYAIIIMILLATALLGFLEAVGVGLVAAMILFVVKSSKVDSVRQTSSGAGLSSRVVRLPVQRETLLLQGDATCVLWLQGYLFFGTAGQLLMHVRSRLDDPALPPLRHLVLDFQRVMGMDSSISETFKRLHQLMQPRQRTLVITQASAAVVAQLALVGLRDGESYRLFTNLDAGLEWCESQLLDEARVVQAEPGAELSLHRVMAELLPDLTAVHRLLPYLRREELATGSWLMRRGDVSEYMYIVASGKLTTQRAHLAGTGREPLRLQTQGVAQVIGEVSFYLGQPYSADVIADQSSVVYGLSAHELRRMELQEPALASLLHQLIVRLLARRVMHLTDSMDALHR